MTTIDPDAGVHSDASVSMNASAGARKPYRTVESSPHHPDGPCPDCGKPPRHLPHGLEVDGTTVHRSCLNCNYAIEAKREREREAERECECNRQQQSIEADTDTDTDSETETDTEGEER